MLQASNTMKCVILGDLSARISYFMTILFPPTTRIYLTEILQHVQQFEIHITKANTHNNVALNTNATLVLILKVLLNPGAPCRGLLMSSIFCWNASVLSRMWVKIAFIRKHQTMQCSVNVTEMIDFCKAEKVPCEYRTLLCIVIGLYVLLDCRLRHIMYSF